MAAINYPKCSVSVRFSQSLGVQCGSRRMHLQSYQILVSPHSESASSHSHLLTVHTHPGSQLVNT